MSADAGSSFGARGALSSFRPVSCYHSTVTLLARVRGWGQTTAVT
ncbi:MAG: hypothetical protein ABSC01_00770 [Verrucomicrobiota bacterium]